MLVGEEFNAGIGEDSEEGSRVATVQAQDTFMRVNVLHSRGNAEPGACVFCELRVTRLKEDLDSVERRDNGFRLAGKVSQNCLSPQSVGEAYRTASNTTSDSRSPDVVEGPCPLAHCLVGLLCSLLLDRHDSGSGGGPSRGSGSSNVLGYL